MAVRSFLVSQPASQTHAHAHLLAELFPALKELLRSHLSGLEELVDGDRKLEGQILQCAAIPRRRQWEGEVEGVRVSAHLCGRVKTLKLMK